MIILLSKVWHDLWSNKSRTMQVVLVIALGSIGIGLVMGGNNLIANTFNSQWKLANPPHIKLGVTPALDDDQLNALKRIEGVDQVQGVLSGSMEWRKLGDTKWQNARLESRPDFRAQKLELIGLITGQWPDRSSLGVIRSADELYGVAEGDTIEVRSNEQVRRFILTGTLKPVGPFPVVFLGQPVFYADRSTFARLTGRDTFNIVEVRGAQWSRSAAEATDLRIQDYFKDITVDSVGLEFPFQARVVSPEVSPGVELLSAIFLILGIIGVIIIILGIFLVYNSISAIITQQISQIGVMKAIGARPWQVLYGYALLVLTYGGLAVMVSIPLGALGARSLQGLFVNLLNLDNPPFRLDPLAVSVQIGVCFVAPLLAAMLPLLAGLRISVREAIATYGLTGSSGLMDRLSGRLRKVPFSLILMVGNAFRNPRRVFFIELTLVLSGVIFMMVLGVNDSTSFTFDNKLRSIHNYQVTLSFENLELAQRLENLARSDPSARAAQAWLALPIQGRPAAQKEAAVTDARFTVFGLPTDTISSTTAISVDATIPSLTTSPATGDFYQPDIIEGRWLTPGDSTAAVITRRLANARGWQVGDRITLTASNDRDTTWEIVGITFDPLVQSAAFVPLTALQRASGEAGRANTLFVQTSSVDPAAIQLNSEILKTIYKGRGMEVAPSSVFRYNTITEIVSNTAGGFSLIIQLLAIMAVIIAVVGGVGLSGVLSLNVLERTREIGVLRSIGASNSRVLRLFMGEGVLLGWLSWLVALPLSIPAAYLMSTVGLSAALNQSLIYHFSPYGALAWLFIITLLALIASALPARSATRVSVRESLIYQ